MPTPSTLDSLAAFRAFVAANPLGVVATVDPAGRPEAALVGFAVSSEGDLVLDSPADARKVANLRRTARVAVVLGGTGELSVQVEGEATVETGAAREAAADEYERSFPGSRVREPGFAVIRVRPDWLRHYDANTAPATVVEGRPQWVSPRR